MNKKGQALIPVLFLSISVLVIFILMLPVFSEAITTFADNSDSSVVSFFIKIIPFVFFIFIIWGVIKLLG